MSNFLVIASMIGGPVLLALAFVWFASTYRGRLFSKRATRRTYVAAGVTVLMLTPWNVFMVNAHQKENQLLNALIIVTCAAVAACLSIILFGRRESSASNG